MAPSILVSSWTDGLFTLSSEGISHDFAGRSVAGLAPDDADGPNGANRSGGPPGGAVAIVDGTTLVRRSADGSWSEVGRSDLEMQCCLSVDGAVYAGTVGAHLLRMRAGGPVERVAGFDETEGREEWFAGSAIIDGKKVGPPLAVRSLAGSRDGDLLLAGIHVGGIARSVDGGARWKPTIDIEWDVHEVCVHPTDPDVVVAASAVGLLISMDGGATWEAEPIAADGSGAAGNHCTAVAFVERDGGHDILVSAARGHFVEHGTVLRRPMEFRGASTGSGALPRSLEPVGGGLPELLDGIVDTGCIAADGSNVAIVDRGGKVYSSTDGGGRWKRVSADTEEIPDPSGIVIVRDGK